MATTIRPAEAKDREAAGFVCSRVLAEDPPYQYELNIGVPECLNLVAEEEGSVVAYATTVLTRWNPQGRFLWERVAPYLAFVGVLPEKQRKGIGGLLLRSTISEIALRCPGEPLLFLEHHRQNPTAKRLFESVGFRNMSGEEVFSMAGLHPRSAVMCFELGAERKTAAFRMASSAGL
jgi:ribosomal protein S18 acetylase RimI-like enzyme